VSLTATYDHDTNEVCVRMNGRLLHTRAAETLSEAAQRLNELGLTFDTEWGPDGAGRMVANLAESEPGEQLTTEQRTAARQVLGQIPLVLLPSHAAGTRPMAVEDLIKIIEHMGKVGAHYLQEAEELKDQRDELSRQFASAGTLLKTIMDAAK
jgi:hypothetical protein